MKRGKRYVEAAKAIDRATLYDTADAIALVKKSAVAKFDETIEAQVRLFVSLYSQKDRRLMRLRLQALTSLEQRI